MSHEHDLQAELARMRGELLALLAVNQTMRASRDLASLYRAVGLTPSHQADMYERQLAAAGQGVEVRVGRERSSAT